METAGFPEGQEIYAILHGLKVQNKVLSARTVCVKAGVRTKHLLTGISAATT
jgi:hypothetical protein